MAANCNISSRDKEVLNQIFSPGLPFSEGEDADEENTEAETFEENEEINKAKELEIQGVKAAELGSIDAAINLFQQALEIAPAWPSSYNNRAQALRLKGDIDGAKADLDKAINLSQGKGKVASQAFTQRGLIRKREGDEEGAKNDFQKAADLGNGFAKQILIAMNPYAALCNQMLSDVMDKLRSGQTES